MEKRQESAHFLNTFLSLMYLQALFLLRKSEVLQAFQRPWPLGFIYCVLSFKLHFFCSLTFDRVLPCFLSTEQPCIASQVCSRASC